MGDAPAIRFYDDHPGHASLREEVLQGLARKPKTIPPKFFYDEQGSRLFDAICELPEYYLTRTEVHILRRYAGEIAALAGPETLLIELGSGASKKVRLLLEALRPAAYLGVDISKSFLLESTRRLAADYPWLEVHAACADFSEHLDLTYLPPRPRQLAFFPGSSIGNFHPPEARAFLGRLARALGSAGILVIGVDLKKDSRILHAAYNDAQGITAAFNLNLLTRIRNQLDTDLDPARFEHRAHYNAPQGRIEMHLVSRDRQRLRIEDQYFDFASGETIHTENSYKYRLDEFSGLAAEAGFRVERVWTDEQTLFAVYFLSVC